MSASDITTPVIIAGARQHDIRAKRTGDAYRIFVSRPLQPPPADGYPVVYVLDGNAVFGTMTEAVRLQSARPAATGVVPAVVVGIGYPTDLPLDLGRRTFDTTPEVDHAALPARPDGSPWPPTGGANAFLDFLEDDVKPMIAAEQPVDPRRQTLFGHSFGGLLTLHALFTRPEAFQAYVAASPSIWFGARTILATEERFAQRLGAEPRDLRLMIGVGSLEQTLTERERADPAQSHRASWIEGNRMVDNAREMAARLGALAPHGLAVAFQELADENHASVIPALASRALRFALAPTV